MLTNSKTLSESQKGPISFKKLMQYSVSFWFVIAVTGQLLFSFYILSFYGGHTVNGTFEGWNDALPHGYESGNRMGNIALFLHLLFAFIITVGGPLQFIPGFRNKFRIFHHWNGRLYLLAALLMGGSGLYLSFSGRNLVGDFSQHLAITIGAILLILFAFLSLQTAMKLNFKAHRRWALRLFMLANGVWFFRVGLMFWLIINGGVVGFDMETFQGPFLTFLAFATFMGALPLTILELYFFVEKKNKENLKLGFSLVLLSCSLVMAVGIFAAFMGMWLPRIG